MRRSIVLAFFVCLCSGLASAGASRVEIFGRGQYLHLDPNFNLEGWNGAFTGNVKGWLGITVDGSGSYHNGLKFHTIAVGPELRVNLPLLKPFVHGLVGGARSTGGGVSADGFVGMIGGGLDVAVACSRSASFKPIGWPHASPTSPTRATRISEVRLES